MEIFVFLLFFFIILFLLVLGIIIPIYKRHYKATGSVINYEKICLQS